MTREEITPVAQIAAVNKIILPLLEKLNINVTVTTKPEGMTLDLKFAEPAAPAPVSPETVFGTETPEDANRLWALRDQIERYRQQHPELLIPDAD